MADFLLDSISIRSLSCCDDHWFKVPKAARIHSWRVLSLEPCSISHGSKAYFSFGKRRQAGLRTPQTHGGEGIRAVLLLLPAGHMVTPRSVVEWVFGTHSQQDGPPLLVLAAFHSSFLAMAGLLWLPVSLSHVSFSISGAQQLSPCSSHLAGPDLNRTSIQFRGGEFMKGGTVENLWLSCPACRPPETYDWVLRKESWTRWTLVLIHQRYQWILLKYVAMANRIKSDFTY